MERDTGLATPFASSGYFFQTGRVEYVHGHGIDQPLRFYREEYSDSIPGASFIPQANWRGVYDMGVRSGLCYMRTWTSQPAEPHGERQIGVDTTSNSVPTSGTETLCADVDWPAQYTWAYHQYRKGYHGPYNWMGSLAFGMRDASGLHYRRHRFYDAEQGRFTQEDPIGLAGGINLYGYANGDPVTYGDPYGLCPYEANQVGRRTTNVNDCPNDERRPVFQRMARTATGRASIEQLAGSTATVRMTSTDECGSTANGCFDKLSGEIILRRGRGASALSTTGVHEIYHLYIHMMNVRTPTRYGWWEEATAHALGFRHYRELPASMRDDENLNYWAFQILRDGAGTMRALCTGYSHRLTCPQ